LRILMTTDTYFPRISGVASSIESFRAGLVRQGHEIDILLPAYDGRKRYAPDDDERALWRIPSWRIPLYPEERFMKFRALRSRRRDMSNAAYDLVHIQTPFIAHYHGVRLARHLRIPVVLSYHTYFEAYVDHYYPKIPGGLRRGSVRRLSRRQCHGVDGVVVPSQAMAEILWGYGVNQPVRVIPTGVKLEHFAEGKGAEFRKQYGITGQRPILLYAGRIAPEKNIPLLFNALPYILEQMPDVLLMLAGDGPARPMLEALVEEQGLSNSVRFLGYLERKEALKDAYAAADLFVFPSQTETQGMVLIEALAAGLPVVGVPALGSADLLGLGKGTRSARNDPMDLASQCVALLRDYGLRARLAAEARQLAAEWSEDRMAQNLSQFYTEIAGRTAAISRRTLSAGAARQR